ncbi:amino acid deaminase [Mycetocola tolaasinivorans]|uniref:Amino acid deaminase n=1 Tax=Mycetocola tolaasinivorans TaxID=76635 RepID=A0A3L7A761_9MICO|nr:amino acid deaminase [Mycetocola tolaasinivorans]RLP75915.1 amino acid deaminase [Mycetocola tolaasinivorans]
MKHFFGTAASRTWALAPSPIDGSGSPASATAPHTHPVESAALHAHLQDLSLHLTALAESTPLSLAAELFRMEPWLADALDSDRDAGVFAHWGHSTAVDENVGLAVLASPVLNALALRAGLPASAPASNAGLLHVYGYLYAPVMTPYGTKRERWIDAELADALGVPPTHFRPADGASTPLARLTEILLPLFSGGPRRGDLLRLREQITPTLAAHTLLYRARPGSATPAALAYALEDAHGLRLITAFPYAGSAGELCTVHVSAPPRLRYNALAA